MGKTTLFTLVTVLLVLTVVYVRLIDRVHTGTLSLPSASFLPDLGVWHGEETALRDYEEDLLRPDRYAYFRYVSPTYERVVYVFLGYFGEQRIGYQIHSPLNCLPGSGWNIVDMKESIPAGVDFRVRRVLAERAGEYREVVYWFVTAEGVTADEYLLKLWLVRNGLMLRPRDALFVRISASVEEPGESREIESFLPVFIERLETWLAQSNWRRSP